MRVLWEFDVFGEFDLRDIELRQPAAIGGD
jgi:hypothetical protein